MTHDLAAAMRKALLATRTRDVAEATRIIQDAVRIGNAGGRGDETADPRGQYDRRPRLLAIDTADAVERSTEPGSPAAEDLRRSGGADRPRATQRVRMPLRDVLDELRRGRSGSGIASLADVARPLQSPSVRPPQATPGSHFPWRSFTCAAGTRSYKLYVPASVSRGLRGIIVMLHGCRQDPEDFATGTNMNAVAEARGLVVAYPGQTNAANVSSCWNWFDPGHQRRDHGEPAIIAGMTRGLMSEFGVEQGRVFVAGLSAGGAMAAVMGTTYPDVYGGVGVHSGLAYGSAHDVVTAFAAMRGECVAGLTRNGRGSVEHGPSVRTIIFQGKGDRTVHPKNAHHLVAAASAHASPDHAAHNSKGRAGGRTYDRTVVAGADGTPVVEYWLVDGAGHAWSGGHPAGSFTDPRGPDASTEMVRFFLGTCGSCTDPAGGEAGTPDHPSDA